MKNPDTSSSQRLAAVNGPVKEIEELQQDLAAILFDVLQRRNAITKNFGSNDEEEINKICSLFTAANRRVVSQRLLNSYCYNRYPVTETSLPVDAPSSSKEILENLPLTSKPQAK